eukprot:m.178980 g.178980  ORF g.178980 m.178980 type:complete len:185 (+) comp10452_c0_seq5:39-593(+)
MGDDGLRALVGDSPRREGAARVFSPYRQPADSSRGLVPMQCFALRVCPDEEIVDVLQRRIRELGLSSAWIMTCVGSVKKATIRLASSDSNHNEIISLSERFEIVSLVGTLGPDDTKHLHIALSDAKGRTIGGHVVSLTVFTTAELVVGTSPALVFHRAPDPKTGFPELLIEDRSAAAGSPRRDA